MAVNGIITVDVTAGIGSGNRYLDFKWTRTSFSSSNNTSTISWEIILRDESTFDNFSAQSIPILLDIADARTTETLVVAKTASLGKGSQTVATGTRTIAHNADGTKSFNVYFEVTLASGDGSTSKQYTVSGTFTLDRITQASGVTCSTVNIGAAPVITINRQDSSYWHRLSYGFGDQEQGYITGTIPGEVSGNFTAANTITNFAWPESFYQVIPNSKSGEGTLFCSTYTRDSRGFTIVGEQTRCNFTANVNEASSSPVFASGYPIIKDINSVTKALTGDESKLIRYASTAEVTIGAQGRNYATIARQKVKNNTNYHEEYTNDLVTIGFGNVESPVFSFELEDSRGFISKPGRDLSATDRFIEYFLPTCNMSNNKPSANGSMTLTCSGNWFNSSFGAVDNALIVQYRWKRSTDEWLSDDYGWQSMSVSHSGNNYQASATFTMWDPDTEEGQEAHRLTYDFQARAIDRLFTATSADYPTKSASIFDWSKEDFQFNVPVKFNAGIIGGELPSQDLSKYALKDDIPKQLPNPYGLTINGQFYDGTSAVDIDVEGGGTDLSEGGTINGDLRVTGDLRIKGDGNYGNTLYFGDGSYASISEPTDDYLLVNASKITLNGSEVNLTATNIYINGTSLDSLISGGGGGGGSSNIDAADGTWTPVLSGYAVSSYTTRQGWYQKVGKVVTIGFTIKATCYTGYNAAQITLSGLPYTPKYDASGGGICSGVYISAGFNFECWAVNTSGQISARVQACNNTSAANLATSASGIFYPSGGGEITIGGTICYITS